MVMFSPLSPTEDIPSPNDCWPTSVPAVTGLEPTELPISTPLYCCQYPAKASCLSTSKSFKPSQEHTSCHLQEVPFLGGPTDRQVEVAYPTFLNPDVQKLLEVQITKRVKLKIWKEKERSNCHLNSLRNMLKTVSDEWTIIHPQNFCNNSIKVEQTKNHERHLQKKFNLLFWGLPFLHSESLVATVRVFGSTQLVPPSVLFNESSNALPIQTQAKEFPLFFQPHPLPHPESQPQSWTPAISQPLAPLLAPVLTQSHCQSFVSVVLDSSTSPNRAYEKSCSTVSNEAQSPIPNIVQHLEGHFLKKQLQSESTLSSMVKRSPEAFSLVNPTYPQAHKSDSILPRDFISPEFSKQLEQHLQERFIQQQWSIPSRTQESLELTPAQGTLPDTNQEYNQHELSQLSKHTGEGKEIIKTMGLGRSKHSGSFHTCCRADFHLEKDLKYSQRKISKYNIFQGSENSLLKVWGTDSEKESKSSSMRQSGTGSENYKKQLENTLKVHLDRKLEKIIEGQIPRNIHCSQPAANHVFLKSDTHTGAGKMTSSEDRAHQMNATHGPFFLDQGTMQMLEEHISRFQMRHKWCLPLKVLKSINLFKIRKAKSLHLSQSSFLCSATHERWANSRVEATKFLGMKHQVGWEEKRMLKPSLSTMESPLPNSSPAGKEVQRNFISWTSSYKNHQPSEATQSGQEGRQSSQNPILSIVHSNLLRGTFLGIQRGSLEQVLSESMTWKGSRGKNDSYIPGGTSCSKARLEMCSESQSSEVNETRKREVVRRPSILQLQDKDTLRNSVLEKSETLNVDLRDIKTPGTSKSPSPIRTFVQDTGKTGLKAQVFSEIKLQVEVEAESSPIDMLLQDCDTDVFFQDCTTDRLFGKDTLTSQAPQFHHKIMLNGDIPVSQVRQEPMVATGLKQQEPKIPNIQDTLESQSKISALPDNKKNCKRPKTKECKEGLLGLEVTETCGISLSVQNSRLGKSQDPPEDHFKKGMKHFLQWVFPSKKDKWQDDHLQKGKPTSASNESHRLVKSKSVFTDLGSAEAQALITAVGQILEEKVVFQQGLHASKLSSQKEIQKVQDPVVGCSLYPGHRRVMNDKGCHHQDISEGQSHPTWNSEIRHRCKDLRKSVRFKTSNLALSSRELMFPVNSQRHRSRMWDVSGHFHHCPKHCLREYVLSRQLEYAASALLSRKTSI
ncbi:spermatogenesis-associated protein 31A3-like [Rhynchocyon petersi]